MMFEDFDAALPLPTQIVVAVSQVFAHFWWLMAIVLIGAVVWVRAYLKTEAGIMFRDKMSLREFLY